MTAANQQQAARVLPPLGSPAESHPQIGSGQHAHVESLVRGFEVLSERINDLPTEGFPLDLFEHFARILNRAERGALARVQTLEKESD